LSAFQIVSGDPANPSTWLLLLSIEYKGKTPLQSIMPYFPTSELTFLQKLHFDDLYTCIRGFAETYSILPIFDENMQIKLILTKSFGNLLSFKMVSDNTANPPTWLLLL
jgi:hypothetical protein